MKNNKCLGAYDLKFNLLDDAGIFILKCLKMLKKLYNV